MVSKPFHEVPKNWRFFEMEFLYVFVLSKTGHGMEFQNPIFSLGGVLEED